MFYESHQFIIQDKYFDIKLIFMFLNYIFGENEINHHKKKKK